MGERQQFLVNHGDSPPQRLVRIPEPDARALPQDLAAVGRVNADEGLHEGGFARPVLTHQRMDRCRPDVEPDVLQGFHPRKALRQIPDL